MSRLVSCALALASFVATPALAQTAAPRPIEAALGAVRSGGAVFPPVNGNETGTDGGPFPLFKSQSRIASSFGLEGGLAFRASRWLQIGVVGSYGRPELITRVTSDTEGAAAADISEETLRFTVQGVVVAHLTRWRLGSRTTPFLTVGGGYLRELHEGRTLVKTGGSYFAGVGLRYMLKRTTPIGIKADVRVVADTGGLALDGRTHAAPALGASIFLGF